MTNDRMRRVRRTDDEITLYDSLRKPLAGDVPLSEIIDPMVREGELYEKLDDGKVHCTACGHNCTISPGGRGICQVRYNLGGKLYVPFGYVAALQSDPIEKKPFYHAYPGADALTFGMLGCDLHCSYCFTGDIRVVTDRGPVRFDELFDSAEIVETRPDGIIARPKGVRATAASGTMREVCAVFRHPYRGKLAIIKPYYLPELKCTADHRLYATDDPSREPEPIQARALTKRHYLAIPRHHSFSTPQTIDVAMALAEHEVTYRVPWKLSAGERAHIATASACGVTSREIGNEFQKSASYIRHVRSKLAHHVASDERTSGLLLERDRARFPNEHRPGIPALIPIDEDMARLLGFYCAEGSVVASKSRPNSHTLTVAFAPDEDVYAQETVALFRRCLETPASISMRDTTQAVMVGKASTALLIKSLAGGRSAQKHVPVQLFDATRPVVEAFVNAYVAGDGHHYGNGKISITTVSPEMAYGIAWLVLRLGYMPSVYEHAMPAKGHIQGREVNQAPMQYTVVWYRGADVKRKLIETETYYLVPLHEISFEDYDGDVYNMEVDVEHDYLAGFFLVKNCQNWDISQAMRDANAGRPPARITPDEMVTLAKRNGARAVVSSYNEPLITSEWARAVFEKAKAAGFLCGYVSNGNATREVLEYIRPYADIYKIDLKTMNDKNYRKLGAVLNNVLDSIRMAHEMGFWLEVVTLVIPGFNDSTDELFEAARFIRSVSPDIPWHVTAFHQDYRMKDPDNTSAKTLIRAAEIGSEAGLNYVYAGNMPGRVGPYEDTHCPNCQTTLIKRIGYVIEDYQITPEGTCPSCGTQIAGVWPKSKKDVRLGTVTDLYFRGPRRVR